MLTQVRTAAVSGLDGVMIEVEVDVANRGFPTFTIVGLPDKAVGEAKDRVRTAIMNAGFEMPDSRITVNLAPADIPKVGSSFDLPIAVGILASSGVIDESSLEKSMFVGELSLEGEVRPVPGIMSMALLAKRNKIEKLFLSKQNSEEASYVQGTDVYPVDSLKQLIAHLKGNTLMNKSVGVKHAAHVGDYTPIVDFSSIKGQYFAKRALEIAAAGFHNIHMKGSPGVGKTMLARAFPAILPPMSFDEVVEVSRIYSAVGMLDGKSFIWERPFRAPHHTTSRNGLIGGGNHPVPGEISLAHRGVLFLDELPEFPRSTLEALRQPLEDGLVTISRVTSSVTFPCRFILLAASNPCPCGFLFHPKKKCACPPSAVINYNKKLSGPLLDRIDLHITVAPVDESKLTISENSESSETIRHRVLSAHKKQIARYKHLGVSANSQLQSSQVDQYCHMEPDATNILSQAIERYSLSTRSYFKVIKVAQTICDLEQGEIIKAFHINEALQYRIQED